jgi:hypothetical protein
VVEIYKHPTQTAALVAGVSMCKHTSDSTAALSFHFGFKVNFELDNLPFLLAHARKLAPRLGFLVWGRLISQPFSFQFNLFSVNYQWTCRKKVVYQCYGAGHMETRNGHQRER